MRRIRGVENERIQVSDSHYDAGCVFCPANGKLVILQETQYTCFVQVMVPHDGTMVPADGAYFVIPKEHYSSSEDVPFDFLREVNHHRRESGLVFDNGNINYTEEGGAKILSHMHYWLIQAQEGDDPLGLYGLRCKVGREKVSHMGRQGGLDALELS